MGKRTRYYVQIRKKGHGIDRPLYITKYGKRYVVSNDGNRYFLPKGKHYKKYKYR